MIQVSNSSCMGSSRPKRQYMLWGLSKSDTSGRWSEQWSFPNWWTIRGYALVASCVDWTTNMKGPPLWSQRVFRGLGNLSSMALVLPTLLEIWQSTIGNAWKLKWTSWMAGVCVEKQQQNHPLLRTYPNINNIVKRDTTSSAKGIRQFLGSSKQYRPPWSTHFLYAEAASRRSFSHRMDRHAKGYDTEPWSSPVPWSKRGMENGHRDENPFQFLDWWFFLNVGSLNTFTVCAYTHSIT